MVNIAANTAFDFIPANGNPATERTITIPATQAGDIVFLTMVMLNNTATHTITAGPAFDGPTVNTRTGISSALWTKKMTANTAAFDVTVSSSLSLGAVLSYEILKAGLNDHIVGPIATLNQASGDPSISVPAFTPSATSYAVDVVTVGAATDLTAELTPPANMDIAGSSLPMVTGRRSGVLYAISDPGETPGTTYTNTSTHYAAVYRVTMFTTAPVTGNPPVGTITSGTPSTAVQNDVVPLRGTVTDSDGTATAAWAISAYPSVLAGPPAVTNPSSLTAASFVPLVAGNYTARLTATDNTGLTDVETKVIAVSLAGTAPSGGGPTARLTWTGTAWV